MFAYYGSDPKLPNLSRLDEYRPKQVTRILDRNNVPIGELGSEKRTVVPFASIPKMFVQAVVAAEDAEYFKHDGVDYMGMVRAFIANVLRGRKAQGGSTITQQVVKNLLLTPERSMRRKVQEIILARRLSEKLSKEEVLALYLNQIYFGHGRYGCEEAARYFFGKSVQRHRPRRGGAAGRACRRARSGCRRASTPTRPRRASATCSGRWPSTATSTARRPSGWRPSRSASRARPAAARGLAAEAVDVVARFLADKLGEAARVRGRHDGHDHARRASCRSWRARRSSGGWRSWTRARASAARRGTWPRKTLDEPAPRAGQDATRSSSRGRRSSRGS